MIYRNIRTEVLADVVDCNNPANLVRWVEAHGDSIVIDTVNSLHILLKIGRLDYSIRFGEYLAYTENLNYRGYFILTQLMLDENWILLSPKLAPKPERAPLWNWVKFDG